MSDLRVEFISSFGNYVPGDGTDMRRRMLVGMLQVPVGQLVGQQMLEPYDLAAQMTCAVWVNPRDRRVQMLLSEVDAWQLARQDAEDNFEDPEKVFFDPQVDNIELAIDGTVSGLDGFLRAMQTTPGGKAYLAQVIACLAWAHRTDIMIPNFYSPAGQE